MGTLKIANIHTLVTVDDDYRDPARRGRAGGGRQDPFHRQEPADAAGRARDRRPLVRGLSGLRQHPPPFLPDADAQHPGGAGCQAVRLAAVALRGVARTASGGRPRQHADRLGRTAAERLHHDHRPFLRLSPLGAAEFLDIEIDTAREIGVRFHPTARQHEPRPLAGRPAARRRDAVAGRTSSPTATG